MEDDSCPNESSKTPSRHLKTKPTTLSANGRSGWSCAKKNSLPTSLDALSNPVGKRQHVRILLRQMTRSLRNRNALKRWSEEETLE